MQFTIPEGATYEVLPATVFPSTSPTIMSLTTDEKFHGAHDYVVRPMLAYDAAKGEVIYAEDPDFSVYLPFAKKMPDGLMRPGLQTEQLLHLLLDRHEKLNAEFPSQQHAQFMEGIAIALNALEFRFRQRMDAGVAGEHAQLPPAEPVVDPRFISYGQALEALVGGAAITRVVWGGYWRMEKARFTESNAPNTLIALAYTKWGDVGPAQPYWVDMLARDWYVLTDEEVKQIDEARHTRKTGALAPTIDLGDGCNAGAGE